MRLRDPRPDDAGPYVQAFADDPALARMVGFEAPTRAQVRRLFARESRDRARGECVRLVMADRADDFRGLILLHSFDWSNRRADCGLLVALAARRRGMALESLRLVVGWAFATLGLQRVGLATLPSNEATQRLAEKAGFLREGILRAYTREWDEPIDNVVFGAVPGDVAWA